MTVSTIDGLDLFSNKYDSAVHFGGRGFSIWDTADLSLVYDSGDEIETHIMTNTPNAFNTDCVSSTITYQSPENLRDTQSGRYVSFAFNILAIGIAKVYIDIIKMTCIKSTRNSRPIHGGRSWLLFKQEDLETRSAQENVQFGFPWCIHLSRNLFLYFILFSFYFILIGLLKTVLDLKCLASPMTKKLSETAVGCTALHLVKASWCFTYTSHQFSKLFPVAKG